MSCQFNSTISESLAARLSGDWGLVSTEGMVLLTNDQSIGAIQGVNFLVDTRHHRSVCCTVMITTDFH